MNKTFNAGYGSSFGGPVFIPKVYPGHDKTFLSLNLSSSGTPIRRSALDSEPSE
jgi:hypothetical protein